VIDGIRTLVTASSIWKIDVTLRRYVRFPRHEAPDPHTRIPYTCEWEPYTALQREGDRLIVYRPVPWGEGAMRMTGLIEWDDLETDDVVR
jgi:hypothetical protein